MTIDDLPSAAGVGARKFHQVFPPGAAIFRVGAADDCAYLIERGRVEISGPGEAVVFAKGDMFGEDALLEVGPRAVTAIALEETEVVVVDRWRLCWRLDRADRNVDLVLLALLDRLRQGDAPASPRPAYAELQRRTVGQPRFASEIARALARDELALHFQPIVRLGDGAMVGVEALARWYHPERGLLAPLRFVNLAERSKLIVDLDRWAVRATCKMLNAIAQVAPGGAELPYIAVNLSSRNFADDSIVRLVVAALDEAGVDPRHLKLEVTESALIDDVDGAAEVLTKLKRLGVGLALDDFGTGFSSLSYLHRLPVDAVKIDRSFLTELDVAGDGAKSRRAVMRAIIAMVRTLDLDIIVEGIDSGTQAIALAEMGAGFGQGYYFAAPAPKAITLDRLRQGRLGL